MSKSWTSTLCETFEETLPLTKGPVPIEKLFGALSELKSGKRIKGLIDQTLFLVLILHAQTENKEYNFTSINNLRSINNIFAVKKDLI